MRDITLESLRRSARYVLFSTIIAEHRLRPTQARRNRAPRRVGDADFIMETKMDIKPWWANAVWPIRRTKQRSDRPRRFGSTSHSHLGRTASVDMETEYAIQALRAMPQQCTKFIIAHRISSVKDADLIIVLDHGRIVEQGMSSYWR